MERWREVSIAHGFEQVDGPTFEQSELYAVKSGEGILGELFQAFSGKSPKDVQAVMETGRGPFALRPEFTPTLARMYAARASSLPKPCKWFMAGPFFRAERPQRGRLREFLQWNVDVLGLDIPAEQWKTGNSRGAAGDTKDAEEVARAKARMDAEVIGCCVAFLESVGLTHDDCVVRVSSRSVLATILSDMGVDETKQHDVFCLLDARPKLDAIAFNERCEAIGLDTSFIDQFDEQCSKASMSLPEQWKAIGLDQWVVFDPSIVRGLAYYTGTVFEVIADGERAVAGGGRYDNLIELFGGPPTPAVGFAMGDVVLSLLLQDKGLMPSDEELMGLVGQQPDVFVLSNGSEQAQARVQPVVAMLRRSHDGPDACPAGGCGSSGGQMLHVRHSYKTTKNIGKLLKEASQVGARFAVILEDAQSCSVKDLHSGQQWDERVGVDQLAGRLRKALGR